MSFKRWQRLIWLSRVEDREATLADTVPLVQRLRRVTAGELAAFFRMHEMLLQQLKAVADGPEKR